jgi:hypothetical protein
MKRRKYIASKVDNIIEKIKNNNKYDNNKKRKKIALFIAFKQALLELK